VLYETVTCLSGSYTGGRVPGATILGRCWRGVRAAGISGETVALGTCAKAETVASANKIPQIPGLFDSICILFIVPGISILPFRSRTILYANRAVSRCRKLHGGGRQTYARLKIRSSPPVKAIQRLLQVLQRIRHAEAQVAFTKLAEGCAR